MSPTFLIAEIDGALSGSIDPIVALTHVRQFLLGGEQQIENQDDFQAWWGSLPTEMKVGKEDAKKAFAKMRKALPPIQQLIRVTLQQAEVRRRTGQAFLYPGTFLRQKRWQDSIDALEAWGRSGRKNTSLRMTTQEREELDNDSRFVLGLMP